MKLTAIFHPIPIYEHPQGPVVRISPGAFIIISLPGGHSISYYITGSTWDHVKDRVIEIKSMLRKAEEMNARYGIGIAPQASRK